MSIAPTQTSAKTAGEGTGDAFNIASYLPRMAASRPEQAAVVLAGSKDRHDARLSFAELERLTNRYANGLVGAGFERGMRTLLMVRPGFDFIALVFALFKIGAVPVMIDPGMGARRMLDCIRSVDLQGFVGIPLAHLMRVLRPRSFRAVKRVITVGRRWCWGGPALQSISRTAGEDFDFIKTRRDETAAVLFTSGATGPAKGVVYQHGMFDAQVRSIQTTYGMKPGEIDLPTFPLFVLFSTAMGMTAVIPDMDPSRPGSADPSKIVDAIRGHGVTTTFGSPVLWRRVADFCIERGIKLPTLRRILIAGAPVSTDLIEKLHRVIGEEADVHTPYGATESLPVTSIGGRERLGECAAKTRTGGGICIGKPLGGVDMRIIRITDDAIPTWGDDLTIPDGEIGEIVVSGPVVTKEYLGLPEATRLAKISDGNRIRHRIGDVGYRDGDGRIWFCGRKAHRVETSDGTLFSVCCEAIFNEHPDVNRSALVGIGTSMIRRAVIVIEPLPRRFPKGMRTLRFREELLELGRANHLTETIRDVLFHKSLPVDIRHNAKINREALAGWAAERLR